MATSSTDLSQPSLITDSGSTSSQTSATSGASAPVPTQYVPILPGDDLAALATRWNTTADAIVSNNNLNPDFILPFQWVWV